MPTTAKAEAQRRGERKSRTAGRRAAEPEERRMNALDLLEQDHRAVEDLFDEFDETEDARTREELAQKICIELTVHAVIEEEIFYPEARNATADNELLDEALVEHASAKELLAEIREMSAGDDLFDAKVKVLGEQMKHHIREEEEELFPELEQTETDLDALGDRLARRKQEMLTEIEKG